MQRRRQGCAELAGQFCAMQSRSAQRVAPATLDLCRARMGAIARGAMCAGTGTAIVRGEFRAPFSSSTR